MVERLQERPNPNPSNSFETLSLNGEVVFARELTLRELKEEGKEWNLVTDVPILFEVRDLGDSLLNIASFSGEKRIGSYMFLSVLSQAKSGGTFRAGQNEYGIIYDWNIILPKVRARDPRKKELYNHHKENIPHFSEFEANHFQKFWNLIALNLAIDAKSKGGSIFVQEIRRLISDYGRRIRRLVVKDIHIPHNRNRAAYLAPLIIWKRDKETGKASYFCGQIPQELIGSHPHLFSKRHDTLLGQLIVSAYSPKARDQMPREITMMGTNGIEVTQKLLEAQSVLLVPMNDQLFLTQSPVILDLEKLFQPAVDIA